MLTNIKLLTSTNIHQRDCKFPTFQCSHTLVCMRVISTAPMSTGVITPTAQMEASSNNLALLHDPKDEPSFHSGCWNTVTNPDLAFTTVGPDSHLPYRRVLEKFPRSQHRPSLITPPRLSLPVPGRPVKRWNFRKANWSHYNSLTNKLARNLPSPDLTNMDQAYQDLCNTISKAAKKAIPCSRCSTYILCWDAKCEALYQSFCSLLLKTSQAGLLQP